ncbi:MAG: hypothetical protein NTW87_25625 [Planctomycetota bacterium]|nr:hypothetical protein [Planctomycetota bacterium]
MASALLLLCVGFGGWYGWEYWKTYGKWTLVYEQDFGKSSDLSAWEFHDWGKVASPWPIGNGVLHSRCGQLAWLRSPRLAGEVRVELCFRFPEDLDGLELFINSELERFNGCAKGYSCQLAGYQGSVDFVSRNSAALSADHSSGAPSAVVGRQVHVAAFQREGGKLSLSVDGNEVSHQADLLPITGSGLDRVGIRCWASEAELLSVRVYRRALARKASPVVAGDALVEGGLLDEAKTRLQTSALKAQENSKCRVFIGV